MNIIPLKKGRHIPRVDYPAFHLGSAYPECYFNDQAVQMISEWLGDIPPFVLVDWDPSRLRIVFDFSNSKLAPECRKMGTAPGMPRAKMFADAWIAGTLRHIIQYNAEGIVGPMFIGPLDVEIVHGRPEFSVRVTLREDNHVQA